MKRTNEQKKPNKHNLESTYNLRAKVQNFTTKNGKFTKKGNMVPMKPSCERQKYNKNYLEKTYKLRTTVKKAD